MAGAKIGGAEAFFMRLVTALAEAGVDQQAVIRTHPERKGILEKHGVPTTSIRFGGALDFLSRYKVQAVAEAYRPDVCLAWMSRAAIAMPKGPWAKVARLGGYYDLKYFRKCDHLVCNTHDLCRYVIREGWPEDKVTYLPNFVDDTPMSAVKRADLDTPEDVPVLVCLGRLHRNKGFDVALDALQSVDKAYLWIAGEGPEREALATQATALGVADRVKFLGWRKDVPALLAAADIFLCSSRHEPLGNIVIEAWAHRTPVVAAASQGPSEIIRHGENGLLCSNENAEEMAEMIVQLLADDVQRAKLVENGRHSFETEFSKPLVVKRYIDFFEQVRRP